MATAVGDYERQLLRMGHIVATLNGKRWKCSSCGQGELTLNRIVKEINGQVALSEARFDCDHCDASLGIHPAQGGGVQPKLRMGPGDKMKFDNGAQFKTAGMGDPTDDGKWR